MTNGFRRPVEHEIAEVGMSIQAPDVGLTEFHQYLVRGLRIAGVSQIIRLGDRIRVEIVRIHTRQDLLHFELRTRTTGDDRSGPVVDGFAPVLFPWVPNAAVLEFQRDEPEGQDRKSTRLNSSHSQISYAVFCLKKKKHSSKCYDVHYILLWLFTV